jgi:two-component system OmpR family response regulator
MSSKPRILIAEDDAGIRDIIRTRLHMAGYEVETARNGVVALSKLSTWRPAANMPELDGFGVLEALGQDAGLTPILVLTARHAAEDVRRAIGLGAKDYLAKPFSESQLLARVARLLRTPRRLDSRVVLI